MGLMLVVVSVGAFANNANEEKKESKVVVKIMGDRSLTENLPPETITLVDGTEDYYTIPIIEGYRFNRYDTSGMTDCVQFSEDIPGARVKFEAQRTGRAVLRIILVSTDGYSTLIIEVYIEVIFASKG